MQSHARHPNERHNKRQPVGGERCNAPAGARADLVPDAGTSCADADADPSQPQEQAEILSEVVSVYAYAVVVEPDGAIRGDWISDSFVRAIGFTKEEIAARGGWVSIVYTADLPVAFRHLERVLDGARDDCELRFVTRDGELRWIHDHAVPVWSEDHSRVVRILGAARDINGQRQAEEALRQSETRLSEALKIARAGHWEYDVASDTFTFNDSFYRLFRTTAEQVGGYQLSSAEYARRFCHPEDAPLVAREVQAAIEATDPGFSRELEHRILYGDGDVGHISVRFFIVQDAQGRTVKTYGVNQDITKRTQDEQQIRLFRSLLDQSNDAVEVLDLETLRFIDVNETACRHLGYRREELLTLTIGDIDPATTAERGQWIRQELQRHGSVFLEAIHRRKDGTTFPVEVNINLVRTDPPRVVAVARDVAERQRADRQRAEILEQLRQSHKMEALGRLAGGVAHDFNNLLVIINNYAAFLIEALEEGDPRREDALEILKAGDRAGSLTKQLLAFSRQEVVEPEHIAVQQAIGELERMLRRMLGEDIDFQVRLDAPRAAVVASPGALEQILVNLAANARDAMPNGGRLSIHLRETSAGEGEQGHGTHRSPNRVELSVTDTGTGMSPEVLQHVFEPFYSTKSVGRGTGLGLATVYGIAKQLGGDVRIQSTVDSGTTVRVILPTQSVTSTENRQVDRKARPLQRPISVLLVEDEKQVRRMVARILRSHKIDVHEACDGAQALAFAAELDAPLDLLITDVIMPNMSGPAVAQDIRNKFPGKPVLFVSGYAPHEQLLELLKTPTVRFLSKPFTPVQLLEKIHELLPAASRADGRS